jgi:hypothetical protein
MGQYCGTIEQWKELVGRVIGQYILYYKIHTIPVVLMLHKGILKRES